ncbi:MAG TPA: gliding motility protein GldN [Chitinophagales bacterium]|nr:gliding motility protein GldN [Chitinophagales bacterium]
MRLLTSVLTVCSLFTTSVLGQTVQSQPPRDAIYDKITLEERQIVPYDHIREADVFWAKRIWRVIDTREKMNLSFKYQKQFLVNILRDHAIEGSITVYDPINDQFTKPLTPEEVAKIGVGEPDTIRVIDPVTLEEKVEVTKPEFDPQKVTKFRLKEDWVFDEETSTLVVRILGVAPVMEDYSSDGSYRGDKVLFWAYYPELRPVLAKYQVFNNQNDAVTTSWEDIFEMRYFSSYIYKESNVHDRRVQDYVTGVDALIESDNIKNKIFLFEHDLWNY